MFKKISCIESQLRKFHSLSHVSEIRLIGNVGNGIDKY